ncbi:MAG TPA: hypothetical protein PKA28_02940 [Methylomusa anaerophila]|uniref:DUF4878 domain-containing protein n=1 Tax=Methylomusa anaerophila TaxID=1930071 RepID=A0A348ANW5_9FIRM|nr:hypothetical protein [Methylomusa anaerophila]BBB92763.1 hypothetical protein MAMMFC1_03464 [Methylomusa anaerophila]HML87386.1 hypothetical protein [Methylomusa anaerophila]
MKKLFEFKYLAVVILIIGIALTAGCGGGSDAQRILGLSAEQVVHTFYDSAKENRMNEAKLYVSPASIGDTQTVLKYVTGQTASTVKNSNLLSVKQVAQAGNYAVIVATLQEQNSLNVSVKPVGLEKIDGEWYIVDYDQIFKNLKYQALAQLMSNIK